jgi:hypothetical protein
MKKVVTILDAQGNPTGAGEDQQELGLPSGVQALIETRVNAGVSAIREHNRDDLQDLARDQTRKWRWVAWITIAYALISTAINAFLVFYAPRDAVKWIGEQIDRKLTEPMLQKSADRLLETKMGDYVSTRLEPLRRQASDLAMVISNAVSAVNTRQEELASQQGMLAGELRIQELAIAAKAGSRTAFTELQQMQSTTNLFPDLISACAKDVELFYDADRYQDGYQILIKAETLNDPGFASDEIVYSMMNGPDYCEEGAINTLGKRKAKAAVREICRKAAQTRSLRAAARTTWTLEEITGEKFRPLAFEHVQKWWDRNQTNTAYCGDYSGYTEVVREMWRPPVTAEKLARFVDELRGTIDTDPQALHSRCLSAGFLFILNRDDEARALLDEVRKSQGDYYWLYVWDAAGHVKTNGVETAVGLLNKAFTKSPTKDVEETIRYWNIFNPIEGSTNVAWPSKKTPNAQPEN